MAFSFENLRVWQESLDLSEKINALIKKFPSEEKYVLSSQIQRAADSICLNIAEGSTGQTKSEFNRFLGIALRSGIEVIACLYLAKRRNLIDEIVFRNLYESVEHNIKGIQALRNTLTQKP
ncbi:MAG: four helix bundle protein [Bacteroidota bacterium]